MTKKSEKIYIIFLCIILVGIIFTLGYFYYQKEVSRNAEDIPLVNHHKQQSTLNIEGDYYMGEQGQGYYQKLEIKKNTGDLYRIAISYGGATKGCSFDAMGKLSNNKIEIALKDIEQNLKQNMIISFLENKTIISSSGKNNNELIYFCGGGSSLAGEYIKSNKEK
ncbi:hypothetical protein M0R01_03395 [bacterium]|nr:hypothetical protein [bacterium]